MAQFFNNPMPLNGAHYIENPAKKFVDRLARAIQYDPELYKAYKSGNFFSGKNLENALMKSFAFTKTAAAVRQAKAAAINANIPRDSEEFEQAINQAFAKTGATRVQPAGEPLSPSFRQALAQAIGRGQGYAKAKTRNRGRYLEVYSAASGKEMVRAGDRMKLKGFRVGKSTKDKRWKGKLKEAQGADAYWALYSDVRRPGMSSANMEKAMDLAARRKADENWFKNDDARKGFRAEWHAKNKQAFADRPSTRGLTGEALALFLAARAEGMDMGQHYRPLKDKDGKFLSTYDRKPASDKKAANAKAKAKASTQAKKTKGSKKAAESQEKVYSHPYLKGTAVANPFYDLGADEFGDLALSNPSGIGFIDSVESTVEGVPMIGPFLAPIVAPAALGAAAAAVHIILIPRVQEYLPEWAQPWAYTIGGSAVGIAGGIVAAKSSDSTVRMAASWIGGAAVAVGLGIDAYRKYNASGATGDLALSGIEDLGESNDMGAMALSGSADMGDLALSGIESRASFGDGGAYQIQNLGFAGDHSALSSMYSDACLADAYFSGPDLDGVEGEACLAGASAFMGAFGAAPIRAAGQRRVQSRHAGLRGHRWAWLIKMIGFENFQKIAALPPEKRVAVIRQLREQAMSSVNRMVDEAKAAQLASQPVTAPAALGHSGASSGYDLSGYGATMFSGQSY